MLKIAINGFGRIGRPSFKIAFEKEDVEIVAVNDLTDIKTSTHLLKYDSSYGRYEKEVFADEEKSEIIVDGTIIKYFSEKDPEKLPWGELGVDIVLECTGAFEDKVSVQKHLNAGAKKVIMSAPAKDDTPVFVADSHQTGCHQCTHCRRNSRGHCFSCVICQLSDVRFIQIGNGIACSSKTVTHR